MRGKSVNITKLKKMYDRDGQAVSSNSWLAFAIIGGLVVLLNVANVVIQLMASKG